MQGMEVPEKMICDGTRSEISGDTVSICKDDECTIKYLEKETSSANRSERSIETLKVTIKKDIKVSISPLVLWCYALERRAAINNATALGTYSLRGGVPHSVMTGEITDTSVLCNFAWFEWVKFRKTGVYTQYSLPSEKLGRCLGPDRNKGNEMSQHV